MEVDEEMESSDAPEATEMRAESSDSSDSSDSDDDSENSGECTVPEKEVEVLLNLQSHVAFSIFSSMICLIYIVNE